MLQEDIFSSIFQLDLIQQLELELSH
ncbi:hypothetical protein CULT_1510010 [[Clostridium] ultunense Esp]|nr:hypothetical protein CULT_1510010 [[Clostridium] ultunense Esp]